MDNEILVAGFALIGTLAGTFGGIMKANQLTNYRIKQLEERVDKHNNLIDRTYKLEERVEVLDQAQKVANHRIKDLETKG